MASSATPTAAGAAPLSFADFLEKMKDPAAADLVRNIKGFIRHFDERSTRHIPNLDTDSAAVQDFLIRMESLFRSHPAWRGSGPEVIDQAIEGLEKYVMSKIWPRTFAASSEERDRDERYSRLAQALSFVNLTTLMGGSAEVIPDEALVTAAVEELTKMDKYKAPRDKLLCLVNVKTLVEDIVGAAVRQGASIGGADAFFPVFLLVVVHARLPRLASNIDYIRRFRARARLHGQFDYMLCNLESAAMYLDTADWQHLGVTRNYFLERLAEAGIPEAAMELRALGEQQKQREEASLLIGELNGSSGGGGDDAAAVGGGSERASEEAAEAASTQNQPLLSIEVPELLGSEAGIDLQNKTTTTLSTSAAIPTADGLTPLGAGPQTPVLMKNQSSILEDTASQQQVPSEPPSTVNRNEVIAATAPEEQSGGGGGSGSGSGGSGAQVVDAMIADGTPLVLEEEAEGRLQQRHPWIYAAAEDLTIADVRSLLAEYRDLVLKYEAVTLSIQQQVNQNSGMRLYSRSISDQSRTLNGATTTGGNLLLGTTAAQGTGSITESAGALIQRLTNWGTSRSPSVQGRQVVAGETAAALQGKAAGAGATGVDTRLLQSLFGSPSNQVHTSRQQLPQLDLLGDLETEVNLTEIGGNVENNGMVGSPALGLIEETQQQQPTAEITESLI
jgi:hypothetical protein